MIDNNLKYCREELEMTQEELGYVFGVSRKTISGWETSSNIIPLKKLIKFCNLYNYSLDFVVGLSRQNDKHINIDKVDKKVIGNNLKKLRAKLNLTQQKIANECMISQTTYSNYELGLYLINTLSLYTICKRHKLSMYEIIK